MRFEDLPDIEAEPEIKLNTEEEVWKHCGKDENVNQFFIWKGPKKKYASLYIIERKRIRY